MNSKKSKENTNVPDLKCKIESKVEELKNNLREAKEYITDLNDKTQEGLATKCRIEGAIISLEEILKDSE